MGIPTLPAQISHHSPWFGVCWTALVVETPRVASPVLLQKDSGDIQLPKPASLVVVEEWRAIWYTSS